MHVLSVDLDTSDTINGPDSHVVHITVSKTRYKRLLLLKDNLSVRLGRPIGLDEILSSAVELITDSATKLPNTADMIQDKDRNRICPVTGERLSWAERAARDARDAKR